MKKPRTIHKGWQALRESGLSCKIISERVGVSTSVISSKTNPPKNRVAHMTRAIMVPVSKNAKIPALAMMLGKINGYVWTNDMERGEVMG